MQNNPFIHRVHCDNYEQAFNLRIDLMSEPNRRSKWARLENDGQGLFSVIFHERDYTTVNGARVYK